MQQITSFSILDEVESTNNYAMQQLHEGLANDGDAWFANQQWSGKGQRAKKWISQKGKNILLSIALKPNKALVSQPFLFSMLVANECAHLFKAMDINEVTIKWPNDIYIGDRKAGGILIENIYLGNKWLWAVVGIGLNINQTIFSEEANNATSLKLVSNGLYEPIALARQLTNNIIKENNLFVVQNSETLLKTYNGQLYKKGLAVQLKKDIALFTTIIKEVNEYGQLVTNDVLERTFKVGDVEWVLNNKLGN